MNNDLISRSAVIDRLKAKVCLDCYVLKAGYSCGGCFIKAALDMIEDVAAVDAEPVRHGRWGKFEKTKHKTVCSECKCSVSFKKQASGYHLAWKSNYCPNCGAKMEEKDN